MQRVAIRVDASTQIGTGHLRRTLSLAKAFRSLGSEVIFVARALDIDVAALLAIDGFVALTLPAPDRFDPPPGSPPHADWAGVSEADDAAQTCSALSSLRPDIVIVDHYAFSAVWHAAIRSSLGPKIAVIDDLADRPLDCDVVVDHNWHADHAEKFAAVLKQPGTRLLAGPRYALLDPKFADAALAPVEKNVASIGVFMGGSDMPNATARVLEGIARSHFGGAVEVVTTSANPHLDELRARVAATDNWSLAQDLPDLAQFMARHGLQIGAGGGATWERCAAGASTIAAMVADNQRASLPPLAQQGVLHLHAGVPVDPSVLAEEINALVQDHARRTAYAAESRALVDGRGSLRVAAALTPVHLREATASDAEQAYAWRNAPETRRLSADPAPIEWPSHQDWWGKAVRETGRHLLMVTLGTREAGILRFDIGEDGSAIVSIYFDPSATGLALGTRVLEAGRQWLIQHDRRAKTMVAQIDDRNLPSRAIFQRAGFARTGSLLYERPVERPAAVTE